MLGVCLIVIMVLFLFELVNNGDLLLLIEKMHHLRVWTRFGLLRLRVMLIRVWFLTGG